MFQRLIESILHLTLLGKYYNTFLNMLIIREEF